MSDALQELRAAVEQAAAGLGGETKALPTLERPKQAEHGDYATNAAMLLKKSLQRPPREIAADLSAALVEQLGERLDRADIAGPGFLNLVLSDAWHAQALSGVSAEGSAWGRSVAAPARNVNIEFVSANPTGPVHVGGARNAAYGDALASCLELAGHTVHREFYVNDYGSQIGKLGESVRARARGEEPAEDGYRGEYIAELAAQIPDAATLELGELSAQAVALMVESARASLERFGVVFDTWYSERQLHDEKKVEHAFDVLAEQGRTFREDGALWLNTPEFGDEKPRVIERASGEHTYFASDIAYHQDKRERGFDLLLDVWGADHHGYVPRMHAAFQALGGAKEDFEMLIMQLVSLSSGGEEVRMSKRAGEFVTVDDLVEDIGVDAARWYLLQRSHDTTIELDLALAKKESSENPVYYVQYAHARLAKILREATAPADPALPAEPLHPSERAMIRAVLAWPGEITEAAARRSPHRVATYALELAQASAAFYRDCKVRGEPSEAFRVAVCEATRTTLASALGVLGVSAPDEM